MRVKDLCAKYLSEYAEEHKKPSSLRMDRRNIENHVLPILGELFIEEVSWIDIDRFKFAVRDGKLAKRDARQRSSYHGGAIVTGGPGVANRCLALLSKMFNLAERWGLRPDSSNPVKHIEKYAEHRKERYLSRTELEALAKELAKAEAIGEEDPYVIGAIRLLILTGARLGEILTLRWEWVRLEHRALLLSDSKTGQKAIYLSRPAIEVLHKLPRLVDNPFVIVGAKPASHLKNLQKPWGRIRKRAGLEDVRIHDLRHTFASVAAAAGLSLPIIGKLLGHSKAATTERYSHLTADPLVAANEIIGERLSSALNGNGPAEHIAVENAHS